MLLKVGLLEIQAAFVICSLSICDFAYMQSRNGLFSGTFPLINSHPWSYYMQICYMESIFGVTIVRILQGTCHGLRK